MLPPSILPSTVHIAKGQQTFLDERSVAFVCKGHLFADVSHGKGGYLYSTTYRPVTLIGLERICHMKTRYHLEALSDATLDAVDTVVLQMWLENKNDGFAKYFIQNLICTGFDAIRGRTLTSSKHSARVRLAHFLLETPAESPALQLKRQEMSQLLGMRIETLIRTVQAFRKAGWISLRPLAVKNRASLEQIVRNA